MKSNKHNNHQIKVLLVVATETEAGALTKITGLRSSAGGYSLGNCDIKLLVTGVGSASTSWAMAKWFSVNQKPDIAINIGIAGSYKDEIKIGDVVVLVSDCFADAGIEDGGKFITLAEAGLEDPDRFPFRNGRIEANNNFNEVAIRLLKPVNAITVNTASGSEQTIDRLVSKYNPDIETMEGATFFYICSREKIPFLAFRSISNRVELRNKKNWNIHLALDNLSERLKEYILMLD